MRNKFFWPNPGCSLRCARDRRGGKVRYKRFVLDGEVQLYAFDCLALDGDDLRSAVRNLVAIGA